MSKIPDHGWKEAERILLAHGWEFQSGRGKGSHRLYEKSGEARPIILPNRHSICRKTLDSAIKLLGLTDEEYRRELTGEKSKLHDKPDPMATQGTSATILSFSGKKSQVKKSRRKMARKSRRKNR